MCATMSGQAVPPPRLQGIAPLTSSSVTKKTEVIDRSHQGDGGLDSSSCTAVGGGGTLAHFLNSAVG